MEVDRMLFYGGAALAAVSLLGGAVAFVILRLQSARLEARLDEEYGPREKKRG